MNMLVLASSLKRFPLAFEVFKLGGKFVLDVEEMISCVAEFLEGFEMLLSKKSLSKIQ